MEWRRCPGLTAGTLLGHASQALLARRLPSALGGAAHSPDQGTIRSARDEPRSRDPRWPWRSSLRALRAPEIFQSEKNVETRTGVFDRVATTVSSLLRVAGQEPRSRFLVFEIFFNETSVRSHANHSLARSFCPIRRPTLGVLARKGRII